MFGGLLSDSFDDLMAAGGGDEEEVTLPPLTGEVDLFDNEGEGDLDTCTDTDEIGDNVLGSVDLRLNRPVDLVGVPECLKVGLRVTAPEVGVLVVVDMDR